MKHISLILSLTSLSISAAIGVGAYITYQKAQKILDNPEEIVDGLIDLCVFALGTLDVFGVDTKAAWDKVYEANMAKSPGVKAGRPNPWGLPDLIKPTKETHGYDWVAPSHEDNHGFLPEVLK